MSEIGLGAALLLPMVPAWLAGASLSAFSGGLLGMYLKTEGMHEPGSIRPPRQGALSMWNDLAVISQSPDKMKAR